MQFPPISFLLPCPEGMKWSGIDQSFPTCMRTANPQEWVRVGQSSRVVSGMLRGDAEIFNLYGNRATPPPQEWVRWVSLAEWFAGCCAEISKRLGTSGAEVFSLRVSNPKVGHKVLPEWVVM